MARFCFDIHRSDTFIFNISSFLVQNIIYCFYLCFIAKLVFPAIRNILPLYILLAILVAAILLFPIHHFFHQPLQTCQGSLLGNKKHTFASLYIAYLLMILYLLIHHGIFEFCTSSYDAYAWLFALIACVLLLPLQYAIIQNTNYHRETSIQENMPRSSEHYYELS